MVIQKSFPTLCGCIFSYRLWLPNFSLHSEYYLDRVMILAFTWSNFLLQVQLHFLEVFLLKLLHLEYIWQLAHTIFCSKQNMCVPQLLLLYHCQYLVETKEKLDLTSLKMLNKEFNEWVFASCYSLSGTIVFLSYCVLISLFWKLVCLSRPFVIIGFEFWEAPNYVRI